MLERDWLKPDFFICILIIYTIFGVVALLLLFSTFEIWVCVFFNVGPVGWI
jgi:hypothetical protein